MLWLYCVPPRDPKMTSTPAADVTVCAEEVEEDLIPDGRSFGGEVLDGLQIVNRGLYHLLLSQLMKRDLQHLLLSQLTKRA